MAKEIFDSKWDDLEYQVNTFCNHLIAKANEKRCYLLQKIQDSKFQAKHIEDSVGQLKNGIAVLETELKGNSIKECQEKMLKEMNTEIKSLLLTEPTPSDFMLVTVKSEILNSTIDNLASIVKIPKQYSCKDLPKYTIAKNQNFVLKYPRSISVDESLDLIAIVDKGCKSIFLFTLSGKFINQFGEKVLDYPVSVKIANNQDIYVTDARASNSIVKFRAAKGKFSEKIHLVSTVNGKYEYPTGLDYDPFTNLLYVTLSTEHAIAIFSQNLAIKEKFNSSIYFPQDIKVTKDEIFVLDFNNPCLHVISKLTYATIRSILPRGISLPLQTAAFFCLDRIGNIVLSDAQNHNVQIYSPSGLLLHTLSQKGHSIGEVFVPSGVYVTKNDDVIVASQNSNYPIQIF
ncbi:E3 ubiquitin-protein ligase TRIM71 [Oopsacas minuta]|uniref:E3 ubiquitin-protein ligase TRIM71 n=1 Tax=Oopsacas minuta TaxID=111878 RepID=A0AAV7JXA1_9METZ|nr:E3 ubiquitin-protein ligase TRIM71 [Oopsacas minuta]